MVRPRRTCATLLLPWNVHPKVVFEMLGHANISIPLDTYSHVIPGMGDAEEDGKKPPRDPGWRASNRPRWAWGTHAPAGIIGSMVTGTRLA